MVTKIKDQTSEYRVRIEGEPAKDFPVCWCDNHIVAAANLIIERRQWPELYHFAGKLDHLIRQGRNRFSQKPLLADCMESIFRGPTVNFDHRGGIPMRTSLWKLRGDPEEFCKLTMDICLCITYQRMNVRIGDTDTKFRIVDKWEVRQNEKEESFIFFLIPQILCDLIMVMYAADWYSEVDESPSFPPEEDMDDYCRDLLANLGLPCLKGGWPDPLPDDIGNPWGILEEKDNRLFLTTDYSSDELPHSLIQVYINGRVMDGKVVDWSSTLDCDLGDLDVPTQEEWDKSGVNRYYFMLKKGVQVSVTMRYMIRIYSGPGLAGWDIFLSDYTMDRLPVRRQKKDNAHIGIYPWADKRMRQRRKLQRGHTGNTDADGNTILSLT